MHTHIEIERKFLVHEPPEGIDGARTRHIRQGYITSGPHGREVRLRSIDGTYVLGVKSGGGVEREETEIELSHTQFDALWPLTEGMRLEKTRYLLPGPDGATIELDIYHGKLEGLRVAEVEFASMEACNGFVPPAWFGREISGDPEFKNARLARDGLPPGYTNELRE